MTIWIIIAVAFLGYEIYTLYNEKRGDTWSEVLRYTFGFSKRQTDTGWRRVLRQLIFWALAIWFTTHIALGW